MRRKREKCTTSDIFWNQTKHFLDIFVDKLCFSAFVWTEWSSMCEEINLKANWKLWLVFPSISCIIWTFKFTLAHMDGWALQMKLARGDSSLFVLISTYWDGSCLCRAYGTYQLLISLFPLLSSSCLILLNRQKSLLFEKCNVSMNYPNQITARGMLGMQTKTSFLK